MEHPLNDSLRRRWLRGALCMAAALPMLPLHAQTKRKLTIGVTAVSDFGLAFVAQERKLFDKQGLEATLQRITLTSNIPAGLVSNSIQIGGITPPVFLQAIDSGIDLVGIACGATYVSAKKTIGVVAKAGGPVAVAQDLIGRKFGVPGLNGNLHLLVRRWLRRSGVDDKRVSFIEVALPNLPQVLAGGSVDAIVHVEPFIARMLQSGGSQLVAGFSEGLPDGWATVVYAATREWAMANLPAVTGFRAALADALQATRDDEAGARADIGKHLNLPEPVQRAMPMANFDVALNQAQLRFWSDTMGEQGMLKKQPSLGSVILA